MTNEKTKPVELGAFSFVPTARTMRALIKLLGVKGNAYDYSQKLMGESKQILTFWDTEKLDLLLSRSLFYQKNGIFHYSEDISYEFGDVLSKRKTKDVAICEHVGIPRQLSNDAIRDYFVKYRGKTVSGLSLKPIETYIVNSIIIMEFGYIDGGRLDLPIRISSFSGENSKKTQKMFGLYNIEFGVVTAPLDSGGEFFERLKSIFGETIHIVRHPFVAEMAIKRNLAL